MSHLGVLAGIDDLPLAVHDPVDGNPGNDIGLDEFKAVHKLSRGTGELRLLLERSKLFLLPEGSL